ncbi:hypothetical protein ACGFI3_31665 [Nonomuraea wenchangensis]|uniref:hypothetical protein n=1 Tax=Nonomuraea wenchangensis TaxID=568860 RepID=UPI0037104835
MNEEPKEPWVPVGVDGIAERLTVSENTVIAWRRRSEKEWVHVARFPPAKGKISGRDWWWWKHVEDWARETGRLKPGHSQGTPRPDGSRSDEI